MSYENDAAAESAARRRQFAQPGSRSALRAAGPRNARIHPCPTCKRPNMLTAADVARHYQCNGCANAEEGCY